jgi:hypothetical protein
MPSKHLTCAICGEPIRMAEVMDGTRDIKAFVIPETGDMVHYHVGCLDGFDVSAYPMKIQVDGRMLGALGLAFTDEQTARVSFEELQNAREASALRVEFISRENQTKYALLIRAKKDHDLDFPTLEPAAPKTLEDSLENHGVYLLIAGKASGNTFEPFEDELFIQEMTEVIVDHKTISGSPKA